jgi:dUTPase
MFRVLAEGCQPTRGSKNSACVDLYAAHDCVIGAGETKLVGLGVAIDLDNLIKSNKQKFEMNFYESCEEGDNGEHFGICSERVDKFLSSNYLQLMLISSLGKKGLILPNGVGVIDLDYEDEIKVIVHNPFSLDGFGIGEYGALHLPSMDRFVEIKKGDKIVQITLLEHKAHMFGIETDNERSGGFGSTGE